ncbi:MAG: TolC family protein [candidate division Zixibacteria bacterium]|nr:TolC family protein [candidate division Zixibacteria bacterium]
MSGTAQTITLDEFLQAVKTTHPLIGRESLTPEIEATNRARALSARNWSVSAEQSFVHTKPISTSPFSPTRVDEIGLRASFQRSLWSTGGRLSVGWQSNFSDQNLPGISLPGDGGSATISTGLSRLYENSMSLNYTQPLLKNYGGKLDRLDYELTDYMVAAGRLQALENQEDFLLDLGNRFLDWVLLEEKKIIAEERLRLANDELDHTREKRKANLVDEVDVLRSEDAVRQARQNLVLLETQLKAKKAELAVLAGLSNLTDMTTDYDIYRQMELPSPAEAYELLKPQSRLLKTIDLQKQQLTRLRGGYTETSRPNLDLGLGVGLKGGDDDFGNALELTKPDFTVLLSFTHQLGGNAAKADIARTDLQLRQLKLQYETVSLQLESTLHNRLVQLIELEKVLALNREQMESAAKKTAEELNLYEQGRGELTFVIQSQDNEQNARLIYAENAAGYHKLLLQYLALTDRLLVVEL